MMPSILAAALGAVTIIVPPTNPYNDAPGPRIHDIDTRVLVDGETVATGITDESGRLVLPEIPAGTVTIEFPTHPFLRGTTFELEPGVTVEFTAKWRAWAPGEGDESLGPEDMTPAPPKPTTPPTPTAPSSPGAADDATDKAAAAPESRTGPDALARTGAGVLGMLLIGVALVVAGMVLAGQHRRRSR